MVLGRVERKEERRRRRRRTTTTTAAATTTTTQVYVTCACLHARTHTQACLQATCAHLLEAPALQPVQPMTASSSCRSRPTTRTTAPTFGFAGLETAAAAAAATATTPTRATSLSPSTGARTSGEQRAPLARPLLYVVRLVRHVRSTAGRYAKHSNLHCTATSALRKMHGKPWYGVVDVDDLLLRAPIFPDPRVWRSDRPLEDDDRFYLVEDMHMMLS